MRLQLTERRSNGPIHLDRTADSYYVSGAALDAAAKRHAEEFSNIDLLDVITELDIADVGRMLAGVKAGDARAVGNIVIAAFADRVQRLAQWSVAA